MLISVPKKLVDKAKELGLDIESIVIDLLLKELSLDPREEAEIHLELAEKYLDEAKKYINGKDPIQASEKMYKAVEEALKALAIICKTPEYEKALKEGRWWTQLLGKTARRLTKMFNEPRIESTWAIAYDLHVWGFHEAKYNIDEVKDDITYIEWIVKYAKEKIKTLT